MILAAILLKLGTYGFVRIALPILPEAAMDWAPWIGLLAVIGIIYGALGCLAQTDMKRLIAFSSVAHMGFVMLGHRHADRLRHQRRHLRHGRPRPHHRHALLPGRLGAGALPHPRAVPPRRPAPPGPRLGWILGFCAMASLGLPGLAGFWGEFPADPLRLRAGRRPAGGDVPHLHGDRRHRHGAGRRLPAVDAPAGRHGHRSRTSSRTPTSTTSTCPSGSPGRPCSSSSWCSASTPASCST